MQRFTRRSTCLHTVRASSYRTWWLSWPMMTAWSDWSLGRNCKIMTLSPDSSELSKNAWEERVPASQRSTRCKKKMVALKTERFWKMHNSSNQRGKGKKKTLSVKSEDLAQFASFWVVQLVASDSTCLTKLVMMTSSVDDYMGVKCGATWFWIQVTIKVKRKDAQAGPIWLDFPKSYLAITLLKLAPDFPL